jgi:PAS domain S-box-containing protein
MQFLLFFYFTRSKIPFNPYNLLTFFLDNLGTYTDTVKMVQYVEQVMARHIATRLETSFFDTTPLGVYQTRPDGTIIAANGAFLNMLGITKRGLHKVNLNSYPLGAMYSRRDFITTLEKKGEIVGWEYEWKKKDGTIIFVRENAHIVRDRRKVLYYEGTIEDITDRKTIERQLMESEENLREAQDRLTFLDTLARDLAKSMDYTSRLKLLSQLVVPKLADWCAIDALDEGVLRNVAIAHVNPEKLGIAKELKRKYPPDPDSKHGIWNVIRTGKPIFISHVPDELIISKSKDENHTKALQKIGMHSLIVLPLIARGNTIGVITLANSEKKHEFTHADFLFAEHITQRAATLVDNARLYGIALEEERRRDHFLGIASHELKNTLAGIKSYTQLLERKLKEDPKNSEYLYRIDVNTNRMKRLIDDLIDLTKLRSQKLTLIYNTFEINELLKEVSEEIQLITKTHKIVLRSDGPVFLSADRMRIRQVVTNLLKNAIKYSPDAHTVIISTHKSKDAVRVSVEDFGTGIDKKDQNKIFNLFYRVEESSRTNGLGVGLYISNEIIKMHNGVIELVSVVGKGSTFTFTLPIETKED